jgi:hypothetical protein
LRATGSSPFRVVAFLEIMSLCLLKVIVVMVNNEVRLNMFDNVASCSIVLLAKNRY